MLANRQRFNKSWDVTVNQANTLSPQSIKIVKQLLEKDINVKVKGFFQEDGEKQKFQDLVKLYKSVGSNIEDSYIDAQTDPTVALAENITTANVAIVTNEQRTVRLTNFNEQQLTNALSACRFVCISTRNGLKILRVLFCLHQYCKLIDYFVDCDIMRV